MITLPARYEIRDFKSASLVHHADNALFMLLRPVFPLANKLTGQLHPETHAFLVKGANSWIKTWFETRTERLHQRRAEEWG
jgi:hypothetical protein